MEPVSGRIGQNVKRVVYSLTRRYGIPVPIFRAVSSTTDYLTGEKSRVTESAIIRRCVPLDNTLRRMLFESGAYLNASRAFTWKGGEGVDANSRDFLILGSDLPAFSPDVYSWVIYENLRYEVARVTALVNRTAFVLSCSAASAEEYGNEIVLSESQTVNITQEGVNGP
jgi:hypothetical protein